MNPWSAYINWKVVQKAGEPAEMDIAWENREPMPIRFQHGRYCWGWGGGADNPTWHNAHVHEIMVRRPCSFSHQTTPRHS